MVDENEGVFGQYQKERQSKCTSKFKNFLPQSAISDIFLKLCYCFI